jgi:hypothetical protein
MKSIILPALLLTVTLPIAAQDPVREDYRDKRPTYLPEGQDALAEEIAASQGSGLFAGAFLGLPPAPNDFTAPLNQGVWTSNVPSGVTYHGTLWLTFSIAASGPDNTPPTQFPTVNCKTANNVMNFPLPVIWQGTQGGMETWMVQTGGNFWISNGNPLTITIRRGGVIPNSGSVSGSGTNVP